MKVVLINSVCGIRSTGKICSETAQMLIDRGDECLVFFGREQMGAGCEKFARKIGNRLTNVLHYFTRILFDDDGKGSFFPTLRLIRQIKKFNPDIIHILNLHGHYVNYRLLMNYLAKSKKPVMFSFFDTWMFTGNCTHFDYIGCEKWQTLCENCPHQSKYPCDKYWLDNATRNYKFKKKCMEKIENKCITPGSFWMESLVRKSFLGNCDIRAVQSGIDLKKFKISESDIRENYGINDKFIILCVASTWTKVKGLEYLNKLADKLPRDCKVAVIGKIKDERYQLSDNIIHIERTNDVAELSKWYSAADVYVNLTLQETLGLTNIEALACGIPVVTFNSGGCPECVDENCGIAIPRGDIDGIIQAIQKIKKDRPFSAESCVKKSLEFDKNLCYEKYIKIYEELIKK